MVTSLRSSNPVRRSYLEWCGPIVPPCVDVRKRAVCLAQESISAIRKSNGLGML